MLSKEAQQLSKALHERYEFEALEESVLLHALEALDEMRRAQAELLEHGITIAGRDGRKANPAARVVAQCRADFLAAVKYLGIDAGHASDHIARKGPYGPKRRAVA